MAGEVKLNQTPEYRTWQGMKQRCHNERATSFKKYGAKGITVCPEWRESFSAFYDYMGPRPSPQHSIDRIDPLGNYEPGNVRWANHVTQANNRTNNEIVTYHGEKITFHEAWRRGGMKVSRQSAWNRFHKFGWPIEKAVEHSQTYANLTEDQAKRIVKLAGTKSQRAIAHEVGTTQRGDIIAKSPAKTVIF